MGKTKRQRLKHSLLFAHLIQSSLGCAGKKQNQWGSQGMGAAYEQFEVLHL